MPKKGSVTRRKLHLAMRHVWEKSPVLDKTPEHRRLREWMERDPKGFLVKMEEMEEDYQKRVRDDRRERGLSGIVDEGSERAEQLIDELLDEIGDVQSG